MLTGVLITVACLALLLLGLVWSFMLSAATAHPIYMLGLLALPVTPVALVVLVLVGDPGWWSVLVAAVPLLLATLGALFPSPSTGWSILPSNRRSRPTGRSRSTKPSAESG